MGLFTRRATKLTPCEYENGILGWICHDCGAEYNGLTVPLDEVCVCHK